MFALYSGKSAQHSGHRSVRPAWVCNSDAEYCNGAADNLYTSILPSVRQQSGEPYVTGGSELSKNLLHYAERNLASAFEFTGRLAQVRDLQTLASLQTEFIQAQTQAMTEQTKELSEAMTDFLKAPTKGGLSS
jgi:hypothetical protein